MTIPSDLMNVAAWCTLKQGFGTAQFKALLHLTQVPRVVCGQTCPELRLALEPEQSRVSLQCWVCARGEQPLPGGLTEVLVVYPQTEALSQALLPLSKQLCLLFVMAELQYSGRYTVPCGTWVPV